MFLKSALIFETTQINGTVFVHVSEHNLDEATRNTLSVVSKITESSYDLRGVKGIGENRNAYRI
jgi:hypothetical protein